MFNKQEKNSDIKSDENIDADNPKSEKKIDDHAGSILAIEEKISVKELNNKLKPKF